MTTPSLATLFDPLPFGVYGVNDRGEVVYANPASKRRHGDPEGRPLREWLASGEAAARPPFERLSLPWSDPAGAGLTVEMEIPQSASSPIADRTAYLESVLESVPVAFTGVDMNGLTNLWNSAAERMFGFRKSETMGRFLPIVPEDRKGQVETRLKYLSAGGSIRGETLPCVRSDGERIEASLFGARLHDARGNPVGYVGALADMTEQRKAEEALRKRLRLERLLNRISSRFINLAMDQIDAGVQSTLEVLGEFFDADRGILISVSLAEKRATVLFEWNSGQAPRIDPDFSPRLKQMNWTLGQLRANRPVFVSGVDPLPVEARAEWDMFASYGLKSGVLVPMSYQGELIGFLGVTSFRRTQVCSHEELPMLGTVADLFVSILVRQQSERLRLETEAPYRTLFESSGIALALVEEDGTIALVNGEFENLTRFSRSELEGVMKWNQLIAREDLEKMLFLGHVQKIDFNLGWRNYEFQLVDQMGGLRVVNTTVASLPGSRRTVRSLVDTTERYRAVNALRAAEERFRIAANCGSDLIFECNIETGVMEYFGGVDAALGFDPGEFPRTLDAWKDRLHPDERERVTREIERVVVSGGRMAVEYRIRRKDGSDRIWSERCRMVGDSAMGRSRMVGVMTDVTETRRIEQDKKRLELQLAQVGKMEAVGRLAGGVAHDFNNLLTGITGNVSIALMDLDKDHPLAPILKEIEVAAQRAGLLTSQLLAFSRKQIIEPKPINLNEVILGLHSMLSRTVGEDMTLRLELDPLLGQITADISQFEQVIVNLVINSRDAMAKGGVCIVRTRNVLLPGPPSANPGGLESGSYILLSVEDNGAGIPEEVRPHVFEPFFTTKPKGKGTGLGLSTVWGIVKQHKGAIDLVSKPGVGSTFHIYWPRVYENAAPLPYGHSSDNLPMGNETILLVEDDPVVREVNLRVLKRLGYRVIVAANGREAIRKFEETEDPIHLLLTDVIMPELNGKQLADRLQPKRPKMKVLFVSGYTEDVILQQGLGESEFNFLGKPHTMQGLALKVREVLDKL